jgi:transcriptional regulator GlxA family with amidase domain
MLIATAIGPIFTNMKQIAILALSDATINSIDSSYQILNRVNDFLKYQGKPPFYTVEIVGTQPTESLNNRLYSIKVNNTIDRITRTDLIVIPLLCGDFSKALEKNKAYADWLVRQYHLEAEIVCLCVGSFLLAATGLLDNRRCAIHWAAKNEFTGMFPKLRTVDDTIITDEEGIYTCGGGYSYLNLLLYIIEKHLGSAFSILASKMFEIDLERKTQQPFIIFIGQKKHGDPDVLKTQEHIENHAEEPLNIDTLCKTLNLSRRNLERRFKKCTGNTVMEYRKKYVK